MKRVFAILIASTAIAAAAGIPAWSAKSGTERFPARWESDEIATLADDGSDDDDHHGGRRAFSDDDQHDEDDDEDASGSANPAPAGTVAPPANGLFGTGPGPRVKVN